MRKSRKRSKRRVSKRRSRRRVSKRRVSRRRVHVSRGFRYYMDKEPLIDMCPVCLEKKELIPLGCGSGRHGVCNKCIVRTLRADTRCPICRDSGSGDADRRREEQQRLFAAPSANFTLREERRMSQVQQSIEEELARRRRMSQVEQNIEAELAELERQVSHWQGLDGSGE